MKIRVVLEIQNISTVAKYLYKAAQTKLRKLIFSKNTFLKINWKELVYNLKKLWKTFYNYLY